MADKAEGAWYYDPETGEVTQGKVRGWENRMGPYESKEAASQALERAEARNEAADAADEAWEDED